MDGIVLARILSKMVVVEGLLPWLTIYLVNEPASEDNLFIISNNKYEMMYITVIYNIWKMEPSAEIQ